MKAVFLGEQFLVLPRGGWGGSLVVVRVLANGMWDVGFLRGRFLSGFFGGVFGEEWEQGEADEGEYGEGEDGV